MNKKDSMLFTTGQFAKFHNINKRTLHYYDEIGLFSPAVKKENGYRYYTYLQSPNLEMLLTLRELDMSVEEIQQYMGNRSAEALIALFQTKAKEIDENISRLREIRRLLIEKKKLLQLPKQVDMDAIEMIPYKEEYLLLSRSITGTYGDLDMAMLIENTQKLQQHRMFNHVYGTMIGVEAFLKKEGEECFFTKVEKPIRKKGLFPKPAGMYLRGFCIGNWDQLPEIYEKILEFAKKKDLVVEGYFYEEGINELAIHTMEAYITQVTVLCRPKP